MILTSASQEIYVMYKVQCLNKSQKHFQIQSVCEKLEHVNSMKKIPFLYSTFSHYGHVGYGMSPMQKQ
jgi:hypothetical protein